MNRQPLFCAQCYEEIKESDEKAHEGLCGKCYEEHRHRTRGESYECEQYL